MCMIHWEKIAQNTKTLKMYSTNNNSIYDIFFNAIYIFSFYTDILPHPDLRANPNARIHVRQDQVTHMHRLSEYQNIV
jgi:hypothetical protein